MGGYRFFFCMAIVFQAPGIVYGQNRAGLRIVFQAPGETITPPKNQGFGGICILLQGIPDIAQNFRILHKFYTVISDIRKSRGGGRPRPVGGPAPRLVSFRYRFGIVQVSVWGCNCTYKQVWGYNQPTEGGDKTGGVRTCGI